MCGIYCSICRSDAGTEGGQVSICSCLKSSAKIKCTFLQIDPATKALLLNRGPDTSSTHSVQHESALIHFAGFVLWQQGEAPCQQPLVNDRFVLLMNGDIYSKRDDTVRSDSQWLSEQIERSTTREELQQLLQGIKGPYSVIFYDKSAKKLLFLRDSLGRQTLLLARRNNGDIAISSVFGKLPTSKLN